MISLSLLHLNNDVSLCFTTVGLLLFPIHIWGHLQGTSFLNSSISSCGAGEENIRLGFLGCILGSRRECGFSFTPKRHFVHCITSCLLTIHYHSYQNCGTLFIKKNYTHLARWFEPAQLCHWCLAVTHQGVKQVFPMLSKAF